MNARELLERCRLARLRIRADGAELVIRAAGDVPAELVEALREHKQASGDARTAHGHPCRAVPEGTSGSSRKRSRFYHA